MISQSKQKGFTIVELLIVIVVIGILAAISIVAYNNVTQKARDDQRISDARSIVNAAASYQAERGLWPTTAELNTYDTVTLSGTAKAVATGTPGRLSSTAVATDGSNKDTIYQYVFCMDGGTGTVTQASATGVQVSYYKEAATSGDAAGVKTLKTGSGARCA